MKELDPTDKFGAGCQGYFYIHPKSGDFLPLAIRPLVKGRENSALVYTPKDEPTDWMLAKLLMNLNQGWHATWAHITQSHSAAEAPYLAAIRTLSDNHPVMVIINRSTFHSYEASTTLPWHIANIQSNSREDPVEYPTSSPEWCGGWSCTYRWSPILRLDQYLRPHVG